MNQKGNLILIIIGVMILAVIILPILMKFFLPIDIIVRIILVFAIVTTVRGYLGNSILTLLISGILIYFLVIKWWWVGAIGWVFITMLSIGFFGVIVWGVGTSLRKG